jgi:RNA polymerase sigma-70 factor (ECF subfamily)
MLAITGFSEQAVARTAENGFARDRSDEALVRAIANGDRYAMQVLYVRHHVKVYRFILRLIDDAALAEDLVSEVFIGVWRQASGFKSKSQVSTWLLAIARNKALSARSSGNAYPSFRMSIAK